MSPVETPTTAMKTRSPDVKPHLTYLERHAGAASFLRRHRGFVLAEVLLLAMVMALNVIVRLHRGPLPGDVGIVLALQRWLLPHRTLSLLLEQVSSVTWPIPAIITLATVVVLLLLLRRRLDALLVAGMTGLGSGSSFLTSLIIQRPRPLGHGLHIMCCTGGYYSFPSGHVEYALTFFGLLLFLTYQTRRTAPWLWPVRLVLLAFIVLMGPSRMLEGQHWASDSLQGYLYGAIWLLLSIQVYRWAARRRPRLLAPGERTVTTHAP